MEQKNFEVFPNFNNLHSQKDFKLCSPTKWKKLIYFSISLGMQKIYF